MSRRTASLLTAALCAVGGAVAAITGELLFYRHGSDRDMAGNVGGQALRGETVPGDVTDLAQSIPRIRPSDFVALVLLEAESEALGQANLTLTATRRGACLKDQAPGCMRRSSAFISNAS